MEIIKTIFTHYTTIGDAKAVAFTNDEAIRRISFVVITITKHDAVHFKVPSSVLCIPCPKHYTFLNVIKNEQIINNQIV